MTKIKSTTTQYKNKGLVSLPCQIYFTLKLIEIGRVIADS
jgi:hypothetical protein